jgi:hypothetical protein
MYAIRVPYHIDDLGGVCRWSGSYVSEDSLGWWSDCPSRCMDAEVWDDWDFPEYADYWLY